MSSVTAFVILQLLFFGYVIWMKIEFGQTDSISRTSVITSQKKRIRFTAWCWLMAAMFPFIHTGLIPAAIALFIMGVTVDWNSTKHKSLEWIHNISAGLTYILALSFLIWEFGWIGAVFTGFSLLYLLLDRIFRPANGTYWLEVALFFIISVGLKILVLGSYGNI